jgi:iron complex transport system permease protein
VSTAVSTVAQARRRPARRTRIATAGLAAALLAAFAARVLLGDFTFTIPDFFRILFGAEIPGAAFILLESKLPRALLGTLVGAAFGAAGAIFQTTLRNPLASPDIIGVSLGASAAAVFAIVSLDQTGTPVAGSAILGAVAVSGLVRWVAGPAAGHRLVLIGVGVAAALSSGIQYLFTRADVYDAQLALRWLTGSLNQVDWPTIRLLAGFLLVLLPAMVWLARSLRIIELGDDAAAGLGVPPRRTDLLLLAAVVLTAVAVAAAGPVAFVSFLAGPISRALNAGRTTVMGAALAGAAIVVAADYVAAYLVVDVKLPVGVVTGALGAPFLLWLLARGPQGRRAA